MRFPTIISVLCCSLTIPLSRLLDHFHLFLNNFQQFETNVFECNRQTDRQTDVMKLCNNSWGWKWSNIPIHWLFIAHVFEKCWLVANETICPYPILCCASFIVFNHYPCFFCQIVPNLWMFVNTKNSYWEHAPTLCRVKTDKRQYKLGTKLSAT